MKKRVVITGLSVCTPIGIGKDVFWDALLQGKSGVRRIQSFDSDGFDSQIAGEIDGFDPSQYIPRKELRRIDRFIQFAIYTAIKAGEDAGLEVPLSGPETERYGVIVGSGIGGLHTLEKEYRVLIDKGPRRLSPFLIPMMIVNLAAGHVSIYLGLKGPNTCVSTACATGTHAIGDAFKIIQRGDADIMSSEDA